MAAFPPNALKCILLLTNKSLQKNRGKEIELGELLQFFRGVLLITRFDLDRDMNFGMFSHCSSVSLHTSLGSIQECATIASKKSG
jgi:hypothetical protein